MKKAMLLFLALSAACYGWAQEETVMFSSNGGIYENSFQLSLDCFYTNHHIRYTTNGNNPTAASTLYEAPLTLDASLYSHSDIYTIQISPDQLVYIPDSVRHAIVIRAAVFDENDSCISPTVTNTYLIESLGFVNDGYAVVSICSDSLSLFDYESGIFVPGINFNPDDPDHSGNYYQKGREWERLANVEFYEPDDNSGINQICGLRTHGNLSRRHPAKGMKIYAREEYGKKRFKHDFFRDSTLTSFKHLLFKPFAVFYPYSGTQDYFCVTLARQLNVESPQCRPVLLYLNGEYWGIYFIQEKTDERFLESHKGVDPDNCNIISNWWCELEHGSPISFREMISWFKEADLTDSQTYEEASNLIDIDNFIDYNVVETFVGNWDWPGNNMRCWQEGNGPWRWIFFDGDATLMGDGNPFVNAAVFTPPQTWINFPESKLLMGKLLKNNQFNERFRHRAQELCETLFRYENTYPIFHNLVEMLRPRIHDQRHRFGYPPTDEYWDQGNQTIQNFLMDRVDQYLSMMDTVVTFETPVYLQELAQFTCYPNPTKGAFHILSHSDTSGQVCLEIFNLLGQRVYQREIRIQEGRNDIPVQASLSSGLYLVRMGNQASRIIIE